MKGIVRLILILPILASAAACGRDGPPTVARAERPNVLLVTIDTLRADHLGCYGHQAADTPTVDGLARRGVRFETAIAPAPLTGPSHASILSGRTPLGHGFRNNSGFVLAPAVSTVAEDFRQAGYRTGAFVSGFPLDRRFGFDRGFEVYDDHLPRGNDRRRTPYVERNADDTTRAVLGWLGASSDPCRRSAPMVSVGPLLRPARALRAASRGPGSALPGVALRRRNCVRRPPPGPLAAGARGTEGDGSHPRARHVGSWREPR